MAGQLGLSEVTVKVRRGSLMRKMNADSLATLVKMSGKLKEADR
ncbi:LuxR C-terminal-related transcriptional regulator [Vibrio vulnificus]